MGASLQDDQYSVTALPIQDMILQRERQIINRYHVAVLASALLDSIDRPVQINTVIRVFLAAEPFTQVSEYLYP
jgi:hypothetical protein